MSQAEIRAKGIDPAVFQRRAIDRYDAEIAHNDHSIEALIGKFKDLGLLENTLVVVASDHGEEFWEHGFGAHGHSLYSELIHVALLMWNPKMIPQPRRIPDTVRLIDIQPTVLDLLGLKLPEGIEGRSLGPLLTGGRLDPSAPAMSTKLALPQAKPGGGVPENLTDSFARVEPDWKLIYRSKAARAHVPEIELYQRTTDRGDRHDVSGAHPDVAIRMKKEVLTWIAQENAAKERLGRSGVRPLDNSTLDRLRSLGYLGGKAQGKEH